MTLNDLQKKAERKQKDVLRASILRESIFPLLIPIAKPKTTAPLEELRATNRLIRSQSKEELGYGYTVEWERIKSRRHGDNEFPRNLTFACAEDYWKYTAQEAMAKRVLANADTICEWFPDARTWCASNLAFLQREPEVIHDALSVVEYLCENPNPGCYARQLPIPVHSKFIEQERALIDSFLKDQCPDCFVASEGAFEERVGLLTKESLIEFRSLDPGSDGLPFRHSMANAADLSARESLFRDFDTVLIVENHIPFLTAPDLQGTLAIMGNGFAVNRLAKIGWLSGKRILYWGDIDISGFSILAQLRGYFPNVESAMMDISTFNEFKPFNKSHSARQVLRDGEMALLNAGERDSVALLMGLSGIRLEQEHISHAFVEATLKRLLNFN